VTTFYDEWLAFGDRSREETRAARRNIHEDELAWVPTVQDERAALLVSSGTGFRTWGTTSMLAEIAPGHHTGQHAHGEEAIFILAGTGYTVMSGVRYDWHDHSVLLIPFGAEHQHFNTGTRTARYLSILCPELEYYCGLHRTNQLEQWGPTRAEPDVPVSADGLMPGSTDRVVLHREHATVRRGVGEGPPELPADLPAFDADHPLVLGDGVGEHKLPDGIHKSETVEYMRINREVNGFRPHAVEMSSLLTDPPHEYGGMHAHMEAHLYILQGTGYSLVDGEKVPWRPGSAIHVPGPQTPHRHVNESDEPATMIRMAFGIRYFFQKVAQRTYPKVYLSPRQGVAGRSAR
jgi:quercetin dioxygenase-like cupin family protein